MSWLEIAGFLALGFAAGGYGTLVGIGGGLLVVPVLIFAHYPAKIAAGTSTVVVLGTALSGSIAYLRQGRVHLGAALAFALPAIPGALLGALVDQYLPQRLFSALFALLLFIVALRSLTSPVGGRPVETSGVVHTRFPIGVAIAVGFFAGVLASVLGVGGGLIFVPTMVYLFGFAAHVATASSSSIIALTAIAGTASHAYYHDIRWGPAIAIALGAIAGAQIGARMAPRVHSQQLMRLFSLGLFAAAAWLAYRSLHGVSP
jgi:uncharacterized membrane protein YfcA